MTKTVLKYQIGVIGNAQTGEKSKRAFPIINKTVSMDQFCNQLATDDGLLIGCETQIKGFLTSVMVKIGEELKKGNAVSFGNYLRFTPTIRGKVDPDTGKPTSETKMGVAILALKNMQLNIEEFSLVDASGESLTPKISFLRSWASGAQVDQFAKGSTFSLVGKNLFYSAEMGDSITLKYSEDGEEKTLSVTPTFGSTELMNFNFPTELESVADGTEIEITIRTRSGVEDGAFSSASRIVTLVSL